MKKVVLTLKTMVVIGIVFLTACSKRDEEVKVNVSETAKEVEINEKALNHYMQLFEDSEVFADYDKGKLGMRISPEEDAVTVFPIKSNVIGSTVDAFNVKGDILEDILNSLHDFDYKLEYDYEFEIKGNDVIGNK